MALLEQEKAKKYWLQASEKIKDRIVAPTLYRAVELGIGITIDGDEFVLGFANEDIPMSGYLKSAQHLPTIEKCISEVVKMRVRLKIVDVTTLEDYEHYLKVQNSADISRTTMSKRREEERKIELAWEEVTEQITRAYSRIHLRAYPQSRAVFMKSAFEIINKGINKYSYTEDSEELDKRCLARVLDKFESCVEIPAALLAYELFKLRDEGKLPK